MTALELVHLAILVLCQVATSAAVWGALRADVRHLITEVAEAKTIANKAHERIDKLLNRQAQS